MKEVKFSTLFRMLLVMRVVVVLPLLAVAIGAIVMMYNIAHPYQVVTANDLCQIDTGYSIHNPEGWSAGDTVFGIYRKVDSKVAFQGKLPLYEQRKLIKLTSDRNAALVYADSINKYSVMRNYIVSIKKI